MRVFFHLLYHHFAFTYDLVAAFVSFGQWKNWVFEILPHIKGTRILELGHGPGHLQRELTSRGWIAFGLDESRQMGRLAAKRLDGKHHLARGLAQRLPFANESFDCVVATFPTEYIFNPQTLTSIKRALRPNGRLVVLPVTFPQNGFLKWLYKVTGESPAALDELLQERLRQPFINAGFTTEMKAIEVKSGKLLFILAKKQDN